MPEIRTPNSDEIRLKKWASRILQEQRIALLDRMPFLGHLSLQLEIIPVIDQDLPVAATDGKHLFVNPKVLINPEKFFARQYERFGHGKHPCDAADIGMNIIAHEVWHCALQHFARRAERNAVLFNYACDVEVGFLLASQNMSNLSDAYCKRSLIGMPAEEIYELLQLPCPTWRIFCDDYSNNEKNSNNQGKKGQSEWEQIIEKMEDGKYQEKSQGSSFEDFHKAKDEMSPNGVSQGHYPKVSPEKITARQQQAMNIGVKDPDFRPEQCGDAENTRRQIKWKELATECIRQDSDWLKKYGDIPGNLSQLLESSGKPSQNWRQLLLEYVSMTLRGEYQWLPPNRRFVHQKLYLPGRVRAKEIEIVLACDTSGSTATLLPTFISELRGMIASFGRYSLTLIQCDSTIHAIHVYDTDSPVSAGKIRFSGFGGTDLRPPFDYVRTNQIRPKVFIYLTDGCGPAPASAPPYPVIWGLVGTMTQVPASWGKIVSIPQTTD